jgi:GDP-L-galactose phosphorylase
MSTCVCEKVLPGEFGFVAQLNEGRHSKKRPTEFRVDQVLQDYDPNKFNFSKVGQEEVLFCFEESRDMHYGYCDEVVVGKSPNIVAINVRKTLASFGY